MKQYKYIDLLIFVSYCIIAIGIPISNAITSIGIGLVFLLWIVSKILKKEKPVFLRDKLLMGLVLLFVLSNLVSFFNTAYINESVRGATKVLKFVLLFFVSLDFFRNAEYKKNFIGVLVGMSLVMYLDALWQHFFNVDIFRAHALPIEEEARRLTASFHEPNSFGGYISVMLLLTMSMFFFGKIKKKLFFSKSNLKFNLS